ncbi:MAG: AraC family transcriptional regulator, partial [Bacteroidota bacterium]
MEKEHIPRISFLHEGERKLGFEVKRLSDFFAEAEQIDHRIDASHRTEFFIILFISKGTGIHHLDFQPLHY